MAKRLIFFVDAWDPAKIARRDKDAFVHNSFEIDREAIEKMPPVDALRWFMEHHNCAVADMLNLAPRYQYRATVGLSIYEDASDAEPIKPAMDHPIIAPRNFKSIEQIAADQNYNHAAATDLMPVGLSKDQLGPLERTTAAEIEAIRFRLDRALLARPEDMPLSATESEIVMLSERKTAAEIIAMHQP